MERSEVSGVEPAAGRWDFDGDCAPATDGDRLVAWYTSFSVGVFQWVKKADGKGLKRSPAACRVKGWVSHPDQAYAEAAVDAPGATREQRAMDALSAALAAMGRARALAPSGAGGGG